MVSHELVRLINSGRCFVLVGAGPSTELGYPSWELLANQMRDHVFNTAPSTDPTTYDRFLKDKDLPALFRQAEIDLGGRAELISALKNMLKPNKTLTSQPIYTFLAKWPFACYITTNFDNELQKSIAAQGQHFQVIYNSVDNLSLLRDGVSHLIVKIHSDLEHADDAVITSSDYDRVLTAPEGDHIRQKLRQAFEMFDMLIVGHSMSDPDLRLILQTAKNTASLMHPIHMILANATKGQIREFRERYNIRLTTYNDMDGTHRDLKKIITMVDRFISPRGTIHVSSINASDEEIELASSILLFQRLKLIGNATDESTFLDSILLFTLAASVTPLSLPDLLKRQGLLGFANSAEGSSSVQAGLERLIESNLVESRENVFAISKKGEIKAQEVKAQKNLEEEQAYGQFLLELGKYLPTLSDSDRVIVKKVLKNALVGAFRSRGIAMANVIMADQSLTGEELSDLFKELSKHATSLPNDALRGAFLEAAHSFLIEPTGPQKAYLASVSQGFFLYHMTGMDPSCTKIRKKLFTNTCWFIDSSVMIPLLAVGCHNYMYAVDLFNKLKEANATLFTTEDLIREVREHLDWAINFMKNNAIDSYNFLSAVMVKEGFKQNLFLDGYVRESVAGTIGTFSDYIKLVAPSKGLERILSEVCKKYGIGVVRAPEMEGFHQNDWGDIEDIKTKLADYRRDRGTFRGDFQVKAEAEVLILIRRLREGKYRLTPEMEASCKVYFVSQSRALDTVGQQDTVVTWTPEAVYRYVSSLPGMKINADLLQECMLHEYFYAGVSFVDKARYLKFFGPSIQQAKISYKEQIDGYLEQTEQIHKRNDYDAAFDSTPDLEKPFFVSQMGWELARKAEQKVVDTTRQAEHNIIKATSKAREAEKRAKAAETRAAADRKAKVTAEQKLAQQRNLSDPKHFKKLAKQAKNRQRKKKKK